MVGMKGEREGQGGQLLGLVEDTCQNPKHLDHFALNPMALIQSYPIIEGHFSHLIILNYC